jgi:Beta-ketoacyl synthase, C-terminal domain
MPKLARPEQRERSLPTLRGSWLVQLPAVPFKLLIFPGTGTPAGDPQEAEAISTAFFGDRGRAPEEEHLYVGSVEAVKGHRQGYLNQPELTAKAFIPDTFTSAEQKARGFTTLFRSGDRGRLRPDRAPLFDGRIDASTQIKLHAFVSNCRTSKLASSTPRTVQSVKRSS